MSEGSGRPENATSSSDADASTSRASDATDELDMRGRRLTQGWAMLAALIAIVLYIGAGRWLDIPVHPGYEVSLLQQPGATRVLAIAVVLLLFLVCAVIGQLVAGRRWIYGGLFAAAVGLAAMSTRGGPSRYVFFHAAATGSVGSVFLTLLLEQLLLFTVVGGVWYTMTKRAEEIADAARDASSPTKPANPAANVAEAASRTLSARPEQDRSTPEKVQAIAAQAVIMALGILLLVHSDSKKTVMIGVFIAAFAATGLAEYWFQDQRMGRWYWAGPLVVGAVGYFISHITAGGGTLVYGQVSGMFAALARPLPLDYAGMGTIGAVLGYWVGKHHEPEEVPDVPLTSMDVLATMVLGSSYLRSREKVIKRNLKRSRQGTTPPAPADNGQPR